MIKSDRIFKPYHSALRTNQLLIAPHEIRHAIGFREIFAGIAVGVHHGAVVELVGFSEFRRHGEVVIEVIQRRPFFIILSNVKLLKSFAQRSPECLPHFIGIFAGYGPSGSKFNRLKQFFGTIYHKILKFIISQQLMINPVCFHISVQF